MASNRIIYTICALCLAFLFPWQLDAQYQIPKSTLGNGGTPIGNTAFQLNSTLGQHVIGVTSDANYQSHLGFWYPIGAAQLDSATWKAQIFIADAGNEQAALTLGQAFTATDSLDRTLGEVELPPIPPSGSFDARFEYPTAAYIAALQDYRNDVLENITWKLKFQPGLAGYPIKLQWNPADLPPGIFVLKDEITGNLVNVNMKTDASATITLSGINSLVIEMTRVSSSWRVNLVFKNAANDMGTLTFGQAFRGTDDLDRFLGEAELPPAPPPAVFDARFELPVVPAKSSVKDFRCDTLKAIVWKLTFQAGTGGFPVTLNWDNTNLPDSDFYLKDAVLGTIVHVNMKQQNSATVTNSAINTLLIEKRAVTTGEVKVVSGWNIISVPLIAADMSVAALFPGATSDAFQFDNGYILASSLATGVGYWLKFAQPDTFAIAGTRVTERRISVKSGWNIIGPFETNVQVAEIASEPAGIVHSEFFSFNNGYKSATTLESGSGYWVKVSQTGHLIMPDGMTFNKSLSSNLFADHAELDLWPKINFQDSNGQNGTLYLNPENSSNQHYELPPVPPPGVFDVRYGSGCFVTSLGDSCWEVLISSARYPIYLSAENLNSVGIHLKGMLAGKEISYDLVAGNSVKIEQPLNRWHLYKTTLENLLPDTYELAQNFPNPFNPMTTIHYSLPEPAHVVISVYNLLGKKVADLVNADIPAGYHQLVVDAQDYASGVYFYVLKTEKFTQVRKMVVIK